MRKAKRRSQKPADGMRFKRLKNFQGRAIVLTFDICSSSDIMEDLNSKGDISRYIALLGEIKRFLAKSQRQILFDPYKFTGDGWVLIFPAADTDGRVLLAFMRELCEFFAKEFKKVSRYLDALPDIRGINFGGDVGQIWHMKVYGADEYVGRSINIACRLQSAIKDKDKSPAYKALVTRALFNDFLSPASGFRTQRVRRTLKNIRDNREFHCVKIRLLDV